MLNPSQIKGGWNRFQQKALDNHYIVSYGWGDGGGGSNDWMIENGRRMAVPMPGMPVVKQTMPREFFEELEERVKDDPRLPKWSGELYLEYHRGTYTAVAKNKRNNRKMELALRDAEWLCTYASKICGFEYPAKELHDLWETVLTLQFHDILPGTSIAEVYETTKKEYDALAQEANALIDERLAQLAGQGSGVTVFNTLGFQRNDVVYFQSFMV